MWKVLGGASRAPSRTLSAATPTPSPPPSRGRELRNWQSHHTPQARSSAALPHRSGLLQLSPQIAGAPHDLSPRRDARARRAAGADRAGPDPGRADHARLHRGQRLPRAQGRADLRLLHPGGCDLHGGAADVPLHQHLREQHRADRGLGRGHPVLGHLRPAGPGHGRLVDRRHPLLADLRGLRRRRRPGGDVHHPPAPGAGHRERPALPRGRRRRRGAEGRRRITQRT